MKNHSPKRLIRSLAGALCLSTLLVACATPSPVALQESQNLFAQGRLDEALVRLEIALKENPNNAELRLALAQTREKIMARQLGS